MVAKDNNKTKKHINNDIKSANVITQAGAPAGGHLGAGVESSDIGVLPTTAID